MKKQYIQPTLRFHKFRIELHVLAGSPTINVKNDFYEQEEETQDNVYEKIDPYVKPGLGNDFN